MFVSQDKKEKAILVQMALPGIDEQSALLEFKELALSAQAEVLTWITGTRATPDPKFFLGLGKVQTLKEAILAHGANLVLINHDISPSQERNLERFLGCRIVDRTGLILDIFAQRARTFEGKLQVELAQLQRLSTRLIRGWTHLERQKGGIGLRGPGETQLETDRRLIRDRIKHIHQRLEKLRKSRKQNRRARQKAEFPTVALVGYTNTGKSTLFNALTGEHVLAANQLFATLDPSMRRVELAGSKAIILADTVGFIRDLPHQLVEAFHATLEETKEADLLLHVIDLADPNWREMAAAVENVLIEIEADTIPIIQVFNKIDLMEISARKEIVNNQLKVWVSAIKQEGFSELTEAIAEALYGLKNEEIIELPPQAAKLRAQLYNEGLVLKEDDLEGGGWRLHLRLNGMQQSALHRALSN